jgi:hypothetical protein
LKKLSYISHQTHNSPQSNCCTITDHVPDQTPTFKNGISNDSDKVEIINTKISTELDSESIPKSRKRKRNSNLELCICCKLSVTQKIVDRKRCNTCKKAIHVKCLLLALNVKLKCRSRPEVWRCNSCTGTNEFINDSTNVGREVRALVKGTPLPTTNTPKETSTGTENSKNHENYTDNCYAGHMKSSNYTCLLCNSPMNVANVKPNPISREYNPFDIDNEICSECSEGLKIVNISQDCIKHKVISENVLKLHKVNDMKNAAIKDQSLYPLMIKNMNDQVDE